MNKKTWFIAITLILITTAALAVTNPSEAPPKSQVVETERSTASTDIPGQHFQKAHENFLKRDTEAAARSAEGG